MSLPKLLAGPIVRRVERESVSFWVALSGDHAITARIWSGLRKAPVSEPALRQSAEMHPKKLGANLWVAVVTLKFESVQTLLANGRIFSYDLTIGGENLKELGLLANAAAQGEPNALDYKPARLALGYATDHLPSFVTPQENPDDVVLAHGSCRRPHGPGEDAIAALDGVIGGSRSDADKRPQQLFLTGDQIYADDVALPLLPMLNLLGRDLFGVDEQLTRQDGSMIPVTNEVLPAGRRSKFCQDEAKFTSGSASCHLISLAEYCAMYLCAFSPDVWQALASEDEVFDPGNSVANSGVTLNELGQEKRISYRRHLKHVAAFRRAVPAARRALANIATYMIFDDHEVTDDWNLTRKWRENVATSAHGRQILRNGHIAYAFFQGWGNDPATFAKKANLKLLDEAATLIKSNGSHDDASAQSIDRMLRLGPPLNAQEQLDEDDHRVKWYTTLKCPNYDVVILDTRTVRNFAGDFTPPDLLGEYLDKQVKGDKNKSFLLLISAAPVLSPPLIDRIAQPLGVAVVDLLTTETRTEFTGKGASTLDIEGWGGDEYAQEALLKKLAPFKRVLVLSGDVHYGYSMSMDYWRGESEQADRIVQLVSSGTHNEFMPIVRAFNRASMLLSEVAGIGLAAERLAWDSNATPVHLPPDTQLSPARRARLRREPVLMPAHGWPDSATLNSENLPSWRWRLKLVYDNRPDTERPGASSIPPFGDDVTFQNPIDDYFRVAAHHNGHAATAPNHRGLVFEPNLGVVKLSGIDDTLSVTHDLYSQDVSVASKHAVNTRHKIEFAPTDEAPPELSP